MRILVVEDDRRLSDILTRSLREESYAVDQAFDGEEAEWLAFENPYDVILLDLMLPRKDGMTVLANIRKAGNRVPVLILTAKDAPQDAVKGLDTGADDYIRKPFSLEELMARVRALLRRPSVESSPLVEVGALRIDPARKEVTREGKVIDLTPKEYALLEYFARHAGSVVSRTQLSEHVWDMNFDPLSNVVDVYVGYLRNKVDKGFQYPMIKTVRGHGYMLDIQEGAAASPSVTTEKAAPSLNQMPPNPARPGAEVHAP